ncbi:MAG: ribbon-helix-helix protein, CopG family [Micrococcaceae bacterium]|nr:ribbon-helix-helix protein, CopG family [Micrococcaceae bacterium]MDN5812822.1 ribbon-helix-helix protein, CopG family [Micrococcaceae bacterium]MDN5824376.1 ribbon-helix-helix protein, CopG family [Micrococcaceae bacterium]MDN5878857.1 ribbon-helix-helix protein, CopG family [Micrococcaceae bacterium]MDN5886309.1 ribbon-helix-helix protein, CopG family [Micrococcaceae bacterium]
MRRAHGAREWRCPWGGAALADTLKKRGRGRPGRGSRPSQVVALRLTEEELSVVDARAEREGKTRSKIIREALAESGA